MPKFKSNFDVTEELGMFYSCVIQEDNVNLGNNWVRIAIEDSTVGWRKTFCAKNCWCQHLVLTFDLMCLKYYSVTRYFCKK